MAQNTVKPKPDSDSGDTDKKENIIFHARNFFQQHSFYGVNIREIMQAAGVSQPTIYYYFKNKDGLFLAVLLDILAEIDEGFADAAKETNLYDRLEHVAVAFMEKPAPNLPMLFAELRQRVELNKLLPGQGISQQDARAAFVYVNLEWPRALETMLKEARRFGEASLDDPTFTAHYLLTLFTAYPHSPFNTLSNRNREDAVGDLMDYLKSTLRMINSSAQI